MKTIITLLGLLFPLFLSSSCIPEWIPRGLECNKNWTLEVRCAYFNLDDKKVTRIYPQGWFDYRIEAGRRFNDYFQLWTSVSWAGKRHGKLPDIYYGLDNDTRINVIPFALGLKIFVPLCSFIEFYVSGGVTYSILSIKNHTRLKYASYTSYYYDSYYYYYHNNYSDGYDYDFYKSIYKKHSRKTAVGGLGTVGIQYSMSDTTFLDVFVEYNAQSFHFSRPHSHARKRAVFTKTIHLNGWKTGAGLGVYF